MGYPLIYREFSSCVAGRGVAEKNKWGSTIPSIILGNPENGEWGRKLGVAGFCLPLVFQGQQIPALHSAVNRLSRYLAQSNFHMGGKIKGSQAGPVYDQALFWG